MLDPAQSDYWQQVPGGTLAMGIDAVEAQALVHLHMSLGLTPERLRDEQPQHPVKVATFEIAKTPLTNSSYQRFVDARAYEDRELFGKVALAAKGMPDDAVLGWVDTSGKAGPSTWEDGHFPPGTEQHPVDGICFFEAAAAARFFGARLPTEAEWEWASRYPDGRPFPWGAGIPSKDIGNFKWNERGGTTPIGSFKDGRSALGLDDLAGNVHEWVDTLYAAYPRGKVRYRFGARPHARVARGGAFNGDLWDLRTTSRFGVNATLRFPGLGVRLAR
jgi:gamma-glutamyl hercynylcysteine S-oxide synthase